MIKRSCAYGLELQDSDGFTHDWCTLIPALELAYKTSIHASIGKTAAILEKGLNPKLPVDTLKRYLVDIHPTASSFKLFLDNVRHNANKIMNDAFEYAKHMWHKGHKTPEFKVGDLILALTLKLNNIKGPKRLKDSFSGPFIIKALHWKNAVDQSEEKKVLKVLKERMLRGKNEREYLVRYRNPQHEYECISESTIPDSKTFLRRLRHDRRPIPQ
ncbi:hypothetical protein O181_072759 [Austropuccinia psidii MF-1]|uniref:Uncharacterized protein n=1 Tax=Austropuccinia psidii MF-1 TaxID=1389203 RepID=A0A9Q3F5T6_9BASI|nr:hypothetical protein [Austropuccinia psidii MF-1]